MRTAPITALAALILTVAVSAPASAATAAPKITSLTASRHSVSGNKATKVTVKAVAASRRVLHVALAARDRRAAEDGGVHDVVRRDGDDPGAIRARTARTFTLTLKATKSGKSASRHGDGQAVRRISRPMSSMSAKPTSLTAAGGKVTIHGTVTHAKTCKLTSTPNLGSKTGSCSAGTFSKSFTVPANTSGSAKFYSFSLKAVGPGGSTTGTLVMGQPAGPVAVTLITSSPASLSADGGTLTVHGTVTGAKTCSMTSTPDVGSGSVAVQGRHVQQGLHHSGELHGSQPVSYSFKLSASGAGGSANATLTLDQPVAAAARGRHPEPQRHLPRRCPPQAASLTVSATLTGASQCTWTMDRRHPDRARARLHHVEQSRLRGHRGEPGSGRRPRTASRLDVTGPGGTASETLTMSQPPVTASVRRSRRSRRRPTSLTADGGTLNIALAVTGAATCSITGDHGVGSVTGADCSSGSYNHDFTIPANNTGTDITYTFDVTATSGANSATGSLSMTQPAAVSARAAGHEHDLVAGDGRLSRRDVHDHRARGTRRNLHDDELTQMSARRRRPTVPAARSAEPSRSRRTTARRASSTPSPCM